MQFRIGVNLEDVIAEDSRIYGDGVSIAARLESLGVCPPMGRRNVAGGPLNGSQIAQNGKFFQVIIPSHRAWGDLAYRS